jgi:predicted nucleotidyltransferase
MTTDIGLPLDRGLGDGDRQQILDVVAALEDALGSALLGAYLHGSAVLGGLRERSDIDVLAVSARETTRTEIDRLLTQLFALSGPDPTTAPPRPLEVTIVVGSEMRPWRYPPRRDFQYGEWLRERFERRDPVLWQSATDPDLAILVTMVLLNGVELAGPSASELFDPVPRADFVDALLSGVPGLIADIHSDTRNVVLTLARIWHGVVAGGVLAKDEAAEWALPRLPPEHRSVLARARDIYVGTEPEDWEDLQETVPAFAEAIVAEIRSARPEAAWL